MFRERASALQGVSLFLDIGCIVAAFALALGLRFVHEYLPVVGRIPAQAWDAEVAARADYAVLLAVSIIAWATSLRASGVYRSHRSERLATVLVAYTRAMMLAVVATAASTFVLNTEISRIFFGYFFVGVFVLLVAKQAVVITVLGQLRRSGYNIRHALIIGSGKPASWFATVLMDAHQAGYSLVGLVLTKKRISKETLQVPVVGTVDELPRILAEYPVDEVFLVGGAAEMAEMAPTAQDLIERGRVVSLVMPLASDQHGVRGRVTEFSGIPMISFGPMPQDEVRSGMKRLTDVAAASVALVVAAPVMVLVAVAIKISGRGPILFAQERLGQGGERFTLYKFRSMRPEAVEILESDPELYARYVANDYKLADDEDPRISPLGRFLRRSSLDELPQLWNVLKGDMTLVGPRPIVPDELAKYEPYGDLLLSVKPGLTGHWQVSGRSGVQYPDRAFMDFDYVGNQAIGSDLSILARTVPAVLRGRGAH
jgi:exopolysaccharide biosynthesis polyprenyl glycosylphosphotransferase